MSAREVAGRVDGILNLRCVFSKILDDLSRTRSAL